MTQKHFEKITEKLLDETKKTLFNKNKEYADTETDVLKAFKHASSLVNQNLTKTLGGMLSKHIVSIYKMMDELSRRCLGRENRRRYQLSYSSESLC